MSHLKCTSRSLEQGSCEDDGTQWGPQEAIFGWRQGFLLRSRVWPNLTQLGSYHGHYLFSPHPLSPTRLKSILQRTQRSHPSSTSLGQR